MAAEPKKLVVWHARSAWESVWQGFVWAGALAVAGAVGGLLKRLGASVDIAVYASLLFFLPSAVVVIFFRRQTKIMKIVNELRAGNSPQLPATTVITPDEKSSAAPFDPRLRQEEILRAMYRKRRLSPLHVEYTHIRAGNSCFVECCPKDFSETWLAQEIEDVSIDRRVRDEIGLVSTLIKDGQESRHKKVVVIVIVYRDLGTVEKSSLMGQLETIRSEDQLSAKMSFRVWDKRDLNS